MIKLNCDQLRRFFLSVELETSYLTSKFKFKRMDQESGGWYIIAIFKGQPILTGALSRNVTIFELMVINSVSSQNLWPEAFSPWTKAGRES
jgi:hypothetical protein